MNFIGITHEAQGNYTQALEYELPALACALILIVNFILLGVPGGLGATLIVAGLILRRAGPWWQRQWMSHAAPAAA